MHNVEDTDTGLITVGMASGIVSIVYNQSVENAWLKESNAMVGQWRGLENDKQSEEAKM